MKIPIIKPNVDRYTKKLIPIIRGILDSNMLTNVHNYTEKFENAIRTYLGVRNVIAVSSCTSGLILTLEALGIKHKEIIIPGFTFVATPASVYWTKNNIKYADISISFTLNPDSVKKAITSKTGAILGVHMYGNPCFIKELTEIARDNDIPLVFDAAHALGSKYCSSRIGKFGDAEVFSLSPTKLITSVEGGLITTNNDELAEKLRKLRNYGMSKDYTSDSPGLNARMSEIHAAIGLIQVKDNDRIIMNRHRYVREYKLRLSDIEGIYFQQVLPSNNSTHKDFSIVVDKDSFGMTRDELGSILEMKGIGIKKYFYPPMHKLRAYENKVKLPMTEHISNNIISLPIHNYMNISDIKIICDLIVGCKK